VGLSGWSIDLRRVPYFGGAGLSVLITVRRLAAHQALRWN
jgi:anti-anti-sigma regulatory factor